MRNTVSKLITALLMAETIQQAQEDDFAAAHISSPDQYEVLLENDRVLILKMTLQPGESDSMHAHRDESVYFERGGSVVITEINGNRIEATVPDCYFMWHPSLTYQVIIVGSSEIIAIIVEEK